MEKIKFTSKKNFKPNKLQRAAGEQASSIIYYKGESIALVCGASRIILYCTPKNICLKLKYPKDHRYAVNYIKDNAEKFWNTYPFTLKLKKEEMNNN